jgi:hypothetical protein
VYAPGGFSTQDDDSFKTEDGGNTWLKSWTVPPGFQGGNRSLGISAVDANLVYFVGMGGKIARTVVTVPVSDFAPGVNDWTTGATGVFGACLRDADLGASGGAGAWAEDTNAGSDCADGNADPWNAIPAAAPGAKIAATAAPDAQGAPTDPVAYLRFGFRSELTQTPGNYYASIVFETVAPNA